MASPAAMIEACAAHVEGEAVPPSIRRMTLARHVRWGNRIGVGERLIRERKVPLLGVRGESRPYASPRPGARDSCASGLTPCPTATPGQEIERRAHIELLPVGALHQREIDGRAARMAGALDEPLLNRSRLSTSG